jgi:hypothetical protein
MAYTETWNAANEASPADADDLSAGAGKIRSLKKNVRERLAKDHYMEIAGTDVDHGEHNKCTLRSQASKPTAAAAKGYLYSKTIADHVELFYEREDGTEVQITGGGVITTSTVIPAGTKMVFYQDTAPAGWTIIDTLDDKVLIVTKGSAVGGQTGGAAHTTGTWTQPAHIHSHAHTVILPTTATWNIGGATESGTLVVATGSNEGFAYINALGHTHFESEVDNTAQSVATAALMNAWRPAAYNVIICSKN